MDHHCPWVNNCVGEKNQRFFVLFTMYIALISAHALGLSGMHFFTCIKSQWNECSNFSPGVSVLLLIFLCLEAILFLTFTTVMFGTQIHSICNDETEIERLKNEKPTWERRVRWDGMKAVFGSPPSLLWCNPFTGLRLRRLILQTYSRRSGSEFSVWEGKRQLHGSHQHLVPLLSEQLCFVEFLRPFAPFLVHVVCVGIKTR